MTQSAARKDAIARLGSFSEAAAPQLHVRSISVQLDLRIGAPVDDAHRGIECDLVQRIFVHFVERDIHQPRKIAFNE